MAAGPAFVIDPRFITVTQWCAQMALSLSAIGNVPQLQDPTQWREWAKTVVNFPALASVGAPRPERFDQWDDWVRQFNLTLRSLGGSP